jgi:SP family myo-inositol transporter-like MFS transporter 13
MAGDTWYAGTRRPAEVPIANTSQVGLGGVPSLLLLSLLPFCPETPRHLINNNRREEARVVLRKLYPVATEEQVNNKVLLIEHGVNEQLALTEGKTIWWKLKQLYTVPKNFRALVVSCGLMAIQQISGFNTLMYYSATLFAMVGFNNPIAVGTVIAGTNFVFTGVALPLIDRIGRRRTLIYTMWGMSVGLVVASIAFHWIPVDKDLTLITSKTQKWPGIVVLVSLVFYVAFYATGLGNVPWYASYPCVFPLLHC